MRSTTKYAWVILILALTIRVLFLVFFMPSGVELIEGGTSDAPQYDKMALNIVDGYWFFEGGEPIFTTPTHPLFLAGIYSIFGHHYEIARFVQAVMWALICVLVFLVGKEIFNKKTGFIAGLVSAFYPPFIIESAVLLKETLFIFFLILFILFLVKAVNNNSLKFFWLSGIFLGLSALTRTIILYFPIFILFYLLLVVKDKKRAIGTFLVLTATAAVIVAPWSIRNYVRSQQTPAYVRYPTTVVSGKGLEGGIPSVESISRQVQLGNSCWNKFYRTFRFPHNLFYFKSYQQRDILSRFVKGQTNIGELFNLFARENFWVKSSFVLVYYLILAFFVASLFFLRRKWKKSLILLLLSGYISGAPLIYSGVINAGPRYKFYIMPFIVIFAAHGAYNLFQKYYFKKKLKK